MRSMLKSPVLSVGLLAATVLAAQAQSVSSIPPNSSSTPNATAQPYASTERIVPDPGGSVSIKDEHYQAPANRASNWADHPYSDSVDGKNAGPRVQSPTS